ncbi:MAG TPA: N-acetyltransferase [Morganella sp. (in: Bacteria)]|nr:N-acetyltransferase [Morganella sp. (in: enterobacteria)]
MILEFKRLTEVNVSNIITLNNHPDVLRHMPLGSPDFNYQKCIEWVSQKDDQWKKHGYGPWAFVINGHFAGWGGLQCENSDADLALVLHPDYWGAGKTIYDEIIRRAFFEMKLESITILLPLSRVKIKTILRLGFHPDGEMMFDGISFRRFRLFATRESISHSV